MTAVATMNHPLQDMQTMAASIARSGLFGMKSEDQALALMLVAQAEGMHPATITQDYDIIQGKACRKSHSVMARFQQSGGKVEWHALTDQLADATFTHPSGGSLRMNWTLKQAADAKLTGKDNWRNYPRAMLRARLIAEAIRAIYPAALGGMLLAEEAQDLDAQSAGEPRQLAQTDASGTEKPPTAKPLLLYTDEQFKENMVKWRKVIAGGIKDVAGVLATVATIAALTEDQIAAIKNIPAELAKAAGQRKPERTGPEIAATYAEVADKLRKATTQDGLNEAATLIAAVPDEGQRKELNTIYEDCAATLG